MASVMGVESQHLATLRAVGALLAGGAPRSHRHPDRRRRTPRCGRKRGVPRRLPGCLDGQSSPGRGSEMSASAPNEFSRRGFLAAAGVTAVVAGAFVAVGSPSAAGAHVTPQASRRRAPRRPDAVRERRPEDRRLRGAASRSSPPWRTARCSPPRPPDHSAPCRLPARSSSETVVAQHETQAAKWNSVLDAAGAPGVLAPDKTLQGVVDQRLPGVTDFGQAAMLARDLEEIAAATYLSAIPKLSDAARDPARGFDPDHRHATRRGPELRPG